MAVQGVLYQSILNAKLTVRKKLDRKRCTSNRDDRKLESTVKQSTWESFTSSGLKLESVHQESPRSDIFRKRATKPLNRNIIRSILPGLNKKITGLLLSDPMSSFQIKVNFAFHLEIKVPESGGRVERHRIHVAWSPVWSFHSQCWFGLPCHLLVLVHCVFWSPQSTQPSTGHFRALHASFCWQALWRCWFHFPAGLGTCPHCQRYQKLVQWPRCYCAWLAANSPDLNPIENLWGIVKRKMRDTRPNNAEDLKAAIKVTCASLHLSSVTGWLPRCHAALMQ